MPDYLDIVLKATRTVVLENVFPGANITVTERLLRDPAAEREKLQHLEQTNTEWKQIVEDFASRLEARKNAPPVVLDETLTPEQKAEAEEQARLADIDTMETQLSEFRAVSAQLDAGIANDVRVATCKTVSQRIIAWDLTEKKKTIPLDYESLYKSGVPTGLLQAIVEALAKEPIIPK